MVSEMTPKRWRHIRKLADSCRGKTYEEIHGVRKAKKLRKMRKAVFKDIHLGKTYAQIMGSKEKARKRILAIKKRYKNRIITWGSKISKKLKGHTVSKATRIKLSLAKGGNGHYFWRTKKKLIAQIRITCACKSWVRKVLKRDRFICQKCFKKFSVRKLLNVHHIKGLAKMINLYNIRTLEEALECKKLWNISNGITFCKRCHISWHRRNPVD